MTGCPYCSGSSANCQLPGEVIDGDQEFDGDDDLGGYHAMVVFGKRGAGVWSRGFGTDLRAATLELKRLREITCPLKHPENARLWDSEQKTTDPVRSGSKREAKGRRRAGRRR